MLAARETVRYARASIRGLDRILQATKSLRRGGELRPADVSRVEIQRDAAQVGLAEAEETLREARRALVPLLNLRLDQAERLELRGSIRDRAPPPPPAEELIRLALEARPDLVAFRLGIQYAQSDVRLAQAQRFQDVFLLAQPYTFQDNSTQPVHLKRPTPGPSGSRSPCRSSTAIRDASSEPRSTSGRPRSSWLPWSNKWRPRSASPSAAMP